MTFIGFFLGGGEGEGVCVCVCGGGGGLLNEILRFKFGLNWHYKNCMEH